MSPIGQSNMSGVDFTATGRAAGVVKVDNRGMRPRPWETWGSEVLRSDEAEEDRVRGWARSPREGCDILGRITNLGRSRNSPETNETTGNRSDKHVGKRKMSRKAAERASEVTRESALVKALSTGELESEFSRAVSPFETERRRRGVLSTTTKIELQDLVLV